MIRFLTAGESHGKCLMGIIEGFPSNLKIDISKINSLLKLRQSGYGRGQRMKIESDTIEILSGVRNGLTLGSPITIKINNKDWDNWQKTMDPVETTYIDKFVKPRPGHADLAGIIKYNHDDVRNILERASARETAMRVAIGGIANLLLEQFGMNLYNHVISLGGIYSNVDFESKIYEKRMSISQIRCLDEDAEKKIIENIEKTKLDGDSLGGIFEVVVTGVPVGLGSHVQWDRKLDARLAGGLMSIHAIKGVEIGNGFENSNKPGSKVHDEIVLLDNKYSRKTNNAGGIEGGISNGMPIIIRAAKKPIPTLYKPLQTVNIETKEICEATVERSDVCALPAASVVGECVVAWEIASSFVEKFGGDSLEEMKNNYSSYLEYVDKR